jgi:DNA-binding NtrC family response regulator
VVIDDELQILDAMQAILSRWGCDVVIADSLGDAIEQLDTRGVIPEMVLSDMRLRDSRTGVEAIDGIRERYGAQIPGALITGESEALRIALSKQSGYEVLQKPVQPAHIRTTIFRHLKPL